MVVSYKDFKAQLEGMVKLRSRNYVNTDCDIDVLIHTVYHDIATEINLKYNKTEVVLTDTTVIELDGEDANIIYGETIQILNSEGYNITSAFQRINYHTYQDHTGYIASHIGETIYFVRSEFRSIENAGKKIYNLLMPAMIEGIMYYIQGSIPSQVDGQLDNASYQRFYKAKDDIKNLLPQFEYASPRKVGGTL